MAVPIVQNRIDMAKRCATRSITGSNQSLMNLVTAGFERSSSPYFFGEQFENSS
jgi:hypothetical protein